MFSAIKDLVLSKLKNDYPVKSFKKNKISFIFGTIVNIFSASLIYLCLLFILKNLFNFEINRHTMQIIVFILEIIIIFQL